MKKTTLTGRFLGMTMLAGLLMAPSAIAQNGDQPEVLMQVVQQRQLVEGSDQVAEARTLFAAPAQPAGPSNRSTIFGAWRGAAQQARAASCSSTPRLGVRAASSPG